MGSVATILDRRDYYRAKAAEVREVAQSLPNPVAREALLSVADDYLRLAEEHDLLVLEVARVAPQKRQT